jgi:hypothetical protein
MINPVRKRAVLGRPQRHPGVGEIHVFTWNVLVPYAGSLRTAALHAGAMAHSC